MDLPSTIEISQEMELLAGVRRALYPNWVGLFQIGVYAASPGIDPNTNVQNLKVVVRLGKSRGEVLGFSG